MSWFSRLRNWQTDQANGIGIRSDYHDSEDDNFAAGLNLSINVAGGNTPTANLPMSGFKHTGAANGSAATDYATLGQAQTLTSSYAVDSSGTDAYAITVSPAIAGYVTGQQFSFYPATANTGAATLNVSGLGAKTIKKDKNTDLADNDIIVGQIVRVIYDGTNFQVQSPIYGQVGQNGSALYAADAGASDTYVITLSPIPAAYATGMVIRFKANTKNTGAATVNVNGLGAKTIKKDQGADLSDNDIAANQIVEAIYDGTNFQMLSPIFGSVGQNGGSIYAADAGVSDAYAITLSPAPSAYTTGMVVRFKASTLNTGAATLAVNSLSAIAIKKFGTTNDIATGDILAGQIVEAIYDGTNFQMISATDDIVNLTTDSSPDLTSDYCKTWDASATTYKKVLLNNFGAIAATQAEQETSTSTTVYVSPGRQQFHPSASKFWLRMDGTGTISITSSYNMTSITDNGTGDYTLTINVDFSSTVWSPFGFCETAIDTTNRSARNVAFVSISAGACNIRTLNNATPEDAALISVFGFGDQ